MTTIDSPDDVASQPAADEMTAAVEFMGRAIEDFGGLGAVVLWGLADELGLLRTLADGPSTADSAAGVAGVDARSALEILRGLTAAGYLTADPAGRFALPTGHAAVLLDGTPLSCAGAIHEAVAMIRMWPQLVDSCRTGSGIEAAAYPPQMAEGMERLGAPSYDSALSSQWVPSVSGLSERLSSGASVADIGCGRGRALLGLAAAYPGVRGTGFDLQEASLAAAASGAETRGLADRIEFRRLDAGEGIPGRYDLVLAFDVLHDAGQPATLAAALRAATADDGVLLVLEPASADDPADNIGPIATVMHLFSVGYCLPVATHAGDARLGTVGLPESALRQLLVEAGFSTVCRLPVEAGLNACYEVRP